MTQGPEYLEPWAFDLIEGKVRAPTSVGEEAFGIAVNVRESISRSQEKASCFRGSSSSALPLPPDP